MFKLFISSFTLFSLAASTTIIPGSLVNITTNESVGSIVIVSGNATGYMTTWQDLTGNGIESFSSNLGQTWTQNRIVTPTIQNSWVSSNSSGFITTWVSSVQNGLGFTYSSFSSNQGGLWSTPAQLSATNTVAPFSTTAANANGFVVCWYDYCSGNGYAKYSSNGTNWSTLIDITSSGYVSSPLMITASANGFMTAWQEFSTPTVSAYISYSATGTTWGTPILVSQITNFRENHIISIASSDAGFMLAWINEENVSYSSFSTDNGQTWSTPSQISDDHAPGCNSPFVSLCGTSFGFVASWVSNSGVALASLSTDNGQTWQTPIALNSSGSPAELSVEYTTVNATAFEDGCMFTWLDYSGNAISCYATFEEAVNPVTNLSGKHLLNRFINCGEYFNSLSWTSESGEIANYLIYRNGILIATLPSSQTSYEDHNQSGSATYTVIAIDQNGNESDPTSITL
jgi:hypothetical protein